MATITPMTTMDNGENNSIVAIGNSVLPGYHHRFLYIVIVAIGANVATVAIGIIFTIVAIGTSVVIGTIIVIGTIVAIGTIL